MDAAETNGYSRNELLVVATAREIGDGDTVFAGVGMPTLGALLAKLSHAPNSIIATEAGGIGFAPKRLTLGIGDNPTVENALVDTSLWRLFSDQQRGFFDIGLLGGAQVDRYGNLNSTVILGGGTYDHPAVRLPGSGGANDIAVSARRTIITLPLERRRFLKRVDYITSPGYLDGGDSRGEAGIAGGGPAAVITDKCIFRFHPETKEACLAALFPGVTADEVREEVSWDLEYMDDVDVIEPPSAEQLRIIRTLDPYGIYCGDGLGRFSFEEYIRMLEDSIAAFS